MKHIKYLFIITVIAMVFLSCKKDDVEEVEETDDYSVTVSGAELTDGYIWETSNSDEEGNMKFVFKNNSTSTIYLRMKILAINGNPDVGYQFCMGTCYTMVTEGFSYPDIDNLVTLDPGEQSLENLNHIESTDNRNESFSFEVKLYQTDENGEELSSKKTVNFTFKFTKA